MPTYADVTGPLTVPESDEALHAEITARPATVAEALSLSDRTTLGPVTVTTDPDTGAFTLTLPVVADVVWTFEIRPLTASGARIVKPFIIGRAEVTADTTLWTLFPTNVTEVGPTTVANIAEMIAEAAAAANEAADSAEDAELAQVAAEAAAALAVDISGISTPDGVITAIDSNPASAFRVQQDARLATTFATVVPVPVATGVAATDWANISAAITKGDFIVALGGRARLEFPACPWDGTTLTRYELGGNEVPVKTNFQYVGVIPSISQTTLGAGYLPDGPMKFVGGTVFHCTGARAFGANTTGVPTPNPTTFGATQISGVVLYGLGFDGCATGIEVGSENTMGLVWSSVDQIYSIEGGGGVKFINYQHVDFGYITTNRTSEIGQLYAAWMPVAQLAPGNSTYRYLFHNGKSGVNTSRGIVFEGKTPSVPGGLASLSVGVVDHIQVNDFTRTLVSQTATFTSGSANVTVTDGTKFRVGMPVIFTTTAAGAKKNVRYYIKTIAANVLTLRRSKFDTAADLVWNANTTATIQTYGFDAIEVASSGNINGEFTAVDCEGSLTVGLYFENAEKSRAWGYFENAVLRGTCGVALTSSNAAVIDQDSTSFRSSANGLSHTFVNSVPDGLRKQGPVNALLVSYGANRVLPSVHWVSGNYHGSIADTYTTTAPPNGQMAYMPIDIPDGHTLDKIGVYVSTGGDAPAVARLGLYKDLNGAPWEILEDFGTVTAATPAYRELSPAVLTSPLPGGRYWLAHVTQLAGTPPTYRAHTDTRGGSNSGAEACLGNYGSGYYKSGITGALPSVATWDGQNGVCPRVVIRTLIV